MRPIVGTSTKMNLTSSEAEHYFRALRPLVQDLSDCVVFVLPPFTSIWVARAELGGTNVAWGAQDVHPDAAGAHTGDISAAMLSDLGCSYIEVGHSERRRDHGETDTLIGAKLRTILRHGMTPILCVGETREGPLEPARAIVSAQLRGSLAGLDGEDASSIIVAYEPVWAIGVGARPAGPAHVAAMHAAIHDWRRSPEGGRADGPVIYGGSVDSASAGALLASDGVDGLFVGRAALDPLEFAAIARVAQDRRSRS